MAAAGRASSAAENLPARWIEVAADDAAVRSLIELTSSLATAVSFFDGLDKGRTVVRGGLPVRVNKVGHFVPVFLVG